MFWTEDEEIEVKPKIPEDVVDLAFSMKSGSLPVDHAQILSDAIAQIIPWFKTEPQCALHLIHGAHSGNGWERPEGEDDLVYPSKRTKLVIRVPKHKIDEARGLENTILTLSDTLSIELTDSKIKPISITTALYSRYVVANDDETEEEFLKKCVEGIQQIGVKFKKILAGRSHYLHIDGQKRLTRSVFVADLKYDDAFRLQENGIGKFQPFGCGVFIPHKTIG